MASSNQSLIIFKESKADLIDLLQQSCVNMATKLWEYDLITDELYNKIIRKGLSHTEYERTRAMLQAIYSKLKPPHAASIMKSLIIVLKKDQAWHAMAAQIEEANLKFPETTVLKKHMSILADNIQGSLVFFANHAESQNILTAPEKQEFTDPSSTHDLLYTQTLMDEVGGLIAKDENETVFDQFLNILSDIGGPLIGIARNLREKKSGNSTC